MKIIFTVTFALITYTLQAQINPAGEKIQYRILKDGNEVAEMSLQVDKQTVTLDKQNCYKITAIGKITAALGIVNFDNKVTSWIDAKRFKPLKLHAYVDDGKSKSNFITDYNYSLGKAVSYTLEKPSDKKTISLPADSEDAFSAFYKIRQTDFKKLKNNDIITIRMVADTDKVEEVKLKYLGKKTMSLYNGEKECYILGAIAPQVEGVEINSFRMAVTADESQIPAKMYVRTKKGFIVSELKSFVKNK
jgi:hypothetical protein